MPGPLPFFTVAVTGHRSAIAGGYWTSSPLEWDNLARPGVRLLRSYLDGVLCRRRDGGRVALLCRGGSAGVDHAVRSYAAARGLPCHPADLERTEWGDGAPLRRDLSMLARAHALVWFGPREEGPDPVTVAALLGIPYRVVSVREPETPRPVGPV